MSKIYLHNLLDFINKMTLTLKPITKQNEFKNRLIENQFTQVQMCL